MSNEQAAAMSEQAASWLRESEEDEGEAVYKSHGAFEYIFE